MEANTVSISDSRVAASRFAAPEYAPVPAEADAQMHAALCRIADQLGWSEEGRGAFGKIVARGARVLIKPNFVLHANEGPWGMEPLITHPSLIRAAVAEALLADPSEVVVGDAPIQGCDFDRLLDVTDLRAWAAELQKREPRFKGIRDFRRTTCVLVNGVRVAEENIQAEDRYVLFDLGRESLLEEITNPENPFRVAWYDPRLMARTHLPGQHQYLVAREVLDADVVINLPKLKTHKKAGVTCALKNLIGINGNKEYLPHHRLGGSQTGGDCYPGESKIKGALEYVADQQNQTKTYAGGMMWHGMTFVLTRVLRLKKDRLGVDGSWSGNDTIWRTSLDLNRILLYGRADATMVDTPQRKIVHLVDAVIAGQGEGPLRPQPLPLGLVLGSANAAAMDWVGAHLLAYDPERIQIAREAFGEFRWRITTFGKKDIKLVGDLGDGSPAEVLRSRREAVLHPIGWRDTAAPTRHTEPDGDAAGRAAIEVAG